MANWALRQCGYRKGNIVTFGLSQLGASLEQYRTSLVLCWELWYKLGKILIISSLDRRSRTVPTAREPFQSGLVSEFELVRPAYGSTR